MTFPVTRTPTTWPRIAHAGVFRVNILAAGQDGLCRSFAVSGTEKFAARVDWNPAPVATSPRLRGTLTWIDCAIHAVHTGDGHLILVGRVDDLGTAEPPAAPLLFYRGAFGGVGDTAADT